MSEEAAKVRPLRPPVPTFEPVAYDAPARRFHREDFDTLEPGKLIWRAKGLWPDTGVCFVGGPSMSGKSFWLLDAMARVTLGEPVLGRKTVPCGVIYIAAEGAAGVRKRIKGLRQKVGPLGGRFDFIGQGPNLCDPSDVEALRLELVAAKDEMDARGVELGIVCVDTLSASVPGADENSAKDMSPVLTALQAMAGDLGVLVLVVAHTGKDETRGLRGWSGLLANADGLIMLEKPDDEEVRIGAVVKVKDGRAGDRFAFDLEEVELGQDDDGDPITTCVIRERDDAPALKAGANARKKALTPDALNVLSALGRMIDEGQTVPVPNVPGAPLEGVAVKMRNLRTKSYDLGLRSGEEPDDLGDEKAVKAWEERRKKAFERALSTLTTAGKVRREGDHIWAL